MLLAPNFIEQASKGNCVLFLGNDAVPGSSNTKSSMDLASVLLQKMGPCNKDFPIYANSLPPIAQQFEILFGRQALIQTIIDQISVPQVNQAPILQQIAHLPFRTILVTSYDCAIEEALRAANKPYATVLTGLDTPYIDEDKVMVYYLHGNISRPETLAITMKDLVLMNRRHEALFEVLRYMFQTRPLLFLEHEPNFGENEFHRLFLQVTMDVDHHRRQGYAVWPNPQPDFVDYWRNENLVILDQTPEKFLHEFAILVQKEKRKAFAKQNPSSAEKMIQKSPYKFLDYYSETDADIFFGRETEIRRLRRLILSERFSILFGASGTGKSSLLRAGILPQLRVDGYIPILVRAIDDLHASIRSETIGYLQKVGRRVPDLPNDMTLKEFFNLVLDKSDRVVVVIDQFEEFFQRQTKWVRQRFWSEFAAFNPAKILQAMDGEPEIHFVLGLREDYLAELEEANEFGLNLFKTRFRLTALNEEKAALVITEPAELVGLHLDEDLVQTLIKDLGEEGNIFPPHLQIVCDRIYQTCLSNKDDLYREKSPQFSQTAITLQGYLNLGGARRILGEYVKDALGKLPVSQQSFAELILHLLVTSSHTKIALPQTEIYKGLVEGGLAAIENQADRFLFQETLINLQRTRLLRNFVNDGIVFFELAHDTMARDIGTGIDEKEFNRKLIRELLRREVESWKALGKPVEIGSLALIHAHRDDIRVLEKDELCLLLRSALEAHFEVDYWAKRTANAGLNLIEIVEPILKDKNSRTRVSAVQALGHGDVTSLSYLKKALKDTHPQVRVAAIQALAIHRSPEAGHFLSEGLTYECFVPAGPFCMGVDMQSDVSKADSISIDESSISLSEQPAHSIYLDGYFIDRFPVTNADYARFLEDNPGYQKPTNWETFAPPASLADHPVTEISWNDACAYAQWAGKRLPTEAEWEKAARGIQDRSFPWGSFLDLQLCNVEEGGYGQTTSVGKFSPEGDSPYGVADMCGNVWEWTMDWFSSGYYANSVNHNPLGPAQGKEKVLRGGSFLSSHERARTFCRYSRSPKLRAKDYGFRCVYSQIKN
jgi:formylglycine-generating enzyme required for sulfatase activity